MVNAKNLPDPEALQRIVDSVSATGKADVLVDVLEKAARDTPVFDAIVARAKKDPQLFAESAATLNLGAFRAAIEQLERLIDLKGVKEGAFQSLLKKYPWMFGSEYSELLGQQVFTRNEKQDFMMRRTTDGYIEIIEIKTPLEGAPLFLLDASHDSYYAISEVSKVVGQVLKYIEKLEAERNSIRVNDDEDTFKIRAKIVIGRDGDANHRKALRSLNGHLHRIEVLTFDDLLSIAKRVTAYLESSLQPKEVPF